jgi:hypothetical protein
LKKVPKSWEWELLQRDGDGMREWWRQHLKGCKAIRLEGMLNYGDVEKEGQRSKMASCQIVQPVAEEVGRAAQAAGVSLFAVWQGLFVAWASRQMEDECDVLVVGPYGRRNMGQFQRTVGYLLNMLVYRYKRSELWSSDLVALAHESGRIVAEAIEHGSNYPFARLMREAGVENAERLMDVMFNWVTGQDLNFVGESRQDSKNVFTVHCDGATLAVESTLFSTLYKLHDVLGSVMKLGTGSMRARPTVELALQEEEWGTGPTMRLGGIVPMTFQGHLILP